MFVPGDHFLDPAAKMLTQDLKIWPGLGLGHFWSENGARGNMVLFGKWFQNPEYGESRDPNGLYGTLEVFGRAGLPQNRPGNCFWGISPIFGNLG